MLTNLAHLKQTKKLRTIVLHNANFMKTKTAREQRKNDKEVSHTKKNWGQSDINSKSRLYQRPITQSSSITQYVHGNCFYKTPQSNPATPLAIHGHSSQIGLPCAVINEFSEMGSIRGDRFFLNCHPHFTLNMGKLRTILSKAAFLVTGFHFNKLFLALSRSLLYFAKQLPT